MRRSKSGRCNPIDSEIIGNACFENSGPLVQSQRSHLPLERFQRFRYTVARAGASLVVTRELLQ